MRYAQRIAAVSAALAVVGSSACSVTTYSAECSNNECSVSLTGEGAETRIGINDVLVTYRGTSNGTATVSIGGVTATCREGETLRSSERPIPARAAMCTKVEADTVDLDVTLL